MDVPMDKTKYRIVTSVFSLQRLTQPNANFFIPGPARYLLDTMACHRFSGLALLNSVLSLKGYAYAKVLFC